MLLAERGGGSLASHWDLQSVNQLHLILTILPKVWISQVCSLSAETTHIQVGQTCCSDLPLKPGALVLISQIHFLKFGEAGLGFFWLHAVKTS